MKNIIGISNRNGHGLSGWDFLEIKNLGFKSYGIAGLKFLRQEVHNDTMGADLATSI